MTKSKKQKRNERKQKAINSRNRKKAVQEKRKVKKEASLPKCKPPAPLKNVINHL